MGCILSVLTNWYQSPQQPLFSCGTSCRLWPMCPWGDWPSPPWSWPPGRRKHCCGGLCLLPVNKQRNPGGYSLHCRGPDLLQPELREVLLTPILGGLAVMGRHSVLCPAATSSIQGFATTFRTYRYSSVLIFSPLAKMWGAWNRPLSLTTPSTITVAEHLVTIMIGTSLMSAQSH